MKNIFVLGSLNMDLVITASNFPATGETVMGRDFMTNPGGKGANQALTCGKLGTGVNTYFIGAVGNDSYGEELITNLKKHQVNVEYINKISGVSTGIAVIILSDRDNRIILDSGANYKIDPEQIKECLESHAQKGDIFVSQLEVPINVVEAGLRLAKAQGLYTILNPAPAMPLNEKIYSLTNLIIVNESEAKTLSGISPVDTDAILLIDRFFKTQGCKAAIITLGGKGSVTVIDNEIIRVPALKVNVTDTTAAGDAYVGTLALELAQGHTLDKAMKQATTVSALTVTKKGAQNSIPSKHELEEFLKSISIQES